MLKKMKISVAEAQKELSKVDRPFVELWHHGSLTVEIYKPEKIDLQNPHDRDEIYVVISGEGTYYLEGQRTAFQAGDFLFAPAGAEHRFENFSENFSTWVFFYGPKGGEQT